MTGDTNIAFPLVVWRASTSLRAARRRVRLSARSHSEKRLGEAPLTGPEEQES